MNLPKIWTLPDAATTYQLGVQLGRCLPPGSTLLLEGDLGAGKTTFIGGIGAGLGIPQPIVSPTFTLLNEYTEGRLPLYHFDLYRLSAAEVETLAPEIYWEGKEVALGITAIEWAERLPYRPDRHWQIHLRYGKGDRRQAEIVAAGENEELLANL
ncbi:MAG: tRNA (adenosine(37)-N6)-threonylcarbamoyltransferase complex ATPase subunit type 1 TsaE [Chloroflexaceae bacterium]|nr:tRNA (adenosine(37)-N6)-threonylcarbamoyltransferase complex ATPase subunit type 1 TsaE [Chloroflexaceae bacterium]